MLMENMNLMIFIGVAIVILLLITFMYIKDAESSKKLRLFERSIEDLNQQIFKLQKRLKELEIEKELPGNSVEDIVKKELQTRLNSSNIQTQNAINAIEKTLFEFKEELGEQIAIVEERVKEMSYIPSSLDSTDDKKVISMYENGWSVDAIAKEFRVPKESINLTLRLANMI